MGARRVVPPGLIALKGEVLSAGEDVRWGRATSQPVTRRSLEVRYGIEQYYVPEGTGRQIERPQGGERVSIRVAVDSRGRAGILAVLLDGREWYRETLL